MKGQDQAKLESGLWQGEDHGQVRAQTVLGLEQHPGMGIVGQGTREYSAQLAVLGQDLGGSWSGKNQGQGHSQGHDRTKIRAKSSAESRPRQERGSTRAWHRIRSG